MRGNPMPIGELARTVGCKVQTIRYYEQIGMLPAPIRTAGGQRRYAEAHRQKLSFIRHARELGFPLPAIRELMALSGHEDSDCARADQIAARQLEAVNRRIDMLTCLRGELERMLTHRQGHRIRDCRVIATLADHGLCRQAHHAESADG